MESVKKLERNEIKLMLKIVNGITEQKSHTGYARNIYGLRAWEKEKEVKLSVEWIN